MIALIQPCLGNESLGNESAPSAEMLEFLSGWESESGESVDPAAWDSTVWEELWLIFSNQPDQPKEDSELKKQTEIEMNKEQVTQGENNER